MAARTVFFSAPDFRVPAGARQPISRAQNQILRPLEMLDFSVLNRKFFKTVLNKELTHIIMFFRGGAEVEG